MITGNDWTGPQLRSLITAEGKLSLFLEEVTEPPPAADELLIEVKAAPVNPSDIGVLLGGVDTATLSFEGTGAQTRIIGSVPERALASMAGRIGKPMPVGLEGAGTVVAAGTCLEHMVGRTVAAFSGGMYARYRRARLPNCIVLPEGASAREGASCFVNPQTALSMLEVMRLGGHRALVHTAAASNLGQMLNRLCQRDGVDLVNIVRSDDQAQVLRAAGARWVCDSAAGDFDERLAEAITETGATLAFDAIGGGTLVARILHAMERAAVANAVEFNRYGSTTMKQVYIYGGLDRSPTVIDRSFGMAWSVGGWLLMPFLETLGPSGVERIRQRIANELTTTFKSHYSRELGLAGLLAPEVLQDIASRATGGKALVTPNL